MFTIESAGENLSAFGEVVGKNSVLYFRLTEYKVLSSLIFCCYIMTNTAK